MVSEAPEESKRVEQNGCREQREAAHRKAHPRFASKQEATADQKENHRHAEQESVQADELLEFFV